MRVKSKSLFQMNVVESQKDDSQSWKGMLLGEGGEESESLWLKNLRFL